MSHRFFIAIAALMLLVSQAVNGQFRANYTQLSGAVVGARAASLGGAVVSTVNDITAIYWNPAGLARSAQVQIHLGASLAPYNIGRPVENIAHNFSQSPLVSDFNPPRDYYFQSAKFDYKQPGAVSNINSVGLSVPFKMNHIRHVLGIFIRNEAGFTGTERAFYEYAEYNLLFVQQMQSMPRVFSIAYAMLPFDDFSIGFSINMPRGEWQYTQDYYTYMNENPPFNVFDEAGYTLVNTKNFTLTPGGRYAEWGFQWQVFRFLSIGSKITKNYSRPIAIEVTDNANPANNVVKEHQHKFPMFSTTGAALHLGKKFRLSGDMVSSKWSRVLVSAADMASYNPTPFDYKTYRFGLDMGPAPSDEAGGNFSVGYYKSAYASTANINYNNVLSLGFSSRSNYITFGLTALAEAGNWTLFAIDANRNMEYAFQKVNVMLDFNIRF